MVKLATLYLSLANFQNYAQTLKQVYPLLHNSPSLPSTIGLLLEYCSREPPKEICTHLKAT